MNRGFISKLKCMTTAKLKYLPKEPCKKGILNGIFQARGPRWKLRNSHRQPPRKFLVLPSSSIPSTGINTLLYTLTGLTHIINPILGGLRGQDIEAMWHLNTFLPIIFSSQLPSCENTQEAT